MFHTDRDFAAFMAGMLLLLGTSTAGVYAVAIVIALVRMAFRSLRALYISFVLSAIASIPFIFVCALNILSGEWLGPETSCYLIRSTIGQCWSGSGRIL